MSVYTERVAFKARKSFKLAGRIVNPGEIVDLTGITLPPRRVEQMERAGLGERVQAVPVTETPTTAPAVTPVPVDMSPPPDNGDVDGSEFPAPSEWTETMLMGFTARQLAELSKQHGVSVRGDKPTRVDRLLAFQQEGHSHV